MQERANISETEPSHRAYDAHGLDRQRRLQIALIWAFPLFLGFIPYVLQRWFGSLIAAVLTSCIALSQSAVIFTFQTRALAPAESHSHQQPGTLRIAPPRWKVSLEIAVCFACCFLTLLILHLFAHSFEFTVQSLEQTKELFITHQGYQILVSTFYGMIALLVWIPGTGLFARNLKRRILKSPSYLLFLGVAAASFIGMRIVNYGGEFFSGSAARNTLGPNPFPDIPAHWSGPLIGALSVGMFALLCLAQGFFMWLTARLTKSV